MKSLDLLFQQITKFIKVHVAFVLRAPDPLIDRFFPKIYQLKGMEPKNKGHMNFYELCYLLKKYI